MSAEAARPATDSQPSSGLLRSPTNRSATRTTSRDDRGDGGRRDGEPVDGLDRGWRAVGSSGASCEELLHGRVGQAEEGLRATGRRRR